MLLEKLGRDAGALPGGAYPLEAPLDSRLACGRGMAGAVKRVWP
jgi:hypothetical protein